MATTEALDRRPRIPRLGAAAALAAIPAGFAIVFAVFPDARAPMTREDGPVEWTSAVMFLAAGAIGFAALVRNGARWSWLLPLAGLIGFGEETAYGMRLLGISPPVIFGEPVDGLHDAFDLLDGLLADAGIRRRHAGAAVAAAALVLLAVAGRRGWLRRAAFWLRAHEAVAFVAAAVALSMIAVVFDLAGTTATARLVEELLEVAAAGILIFGALRMHRRGTPRGSRAEGAP